LLGKNAFAFLISLLELILIYYRKIDMMNSDALEEDEYKSRNKKKKRRGKSKKPAVDDSAFHFVAYMPISQEIWRLDGLDSYPQRLGPCGQDNWLDLVVGTLQDRMEGALEFNLLALIRDPLSIAVDELAYNIKFHHAIEERLDSITSKWRSFADAPDEDVLTGTDEWHCITEEALHHANITEEHTRKLSKFESADELLELREKNNREQGRLRASVAAELRAAEMDDEKATDRRNEYGPLVQRWLMMLAENGKLREIHEELQ
jgi:ubiquitin carboxyl-terminal hydrolase L5